MSKLWIWGMNYLGGGDGVLEFFSDEDMYIYIYIYISVVEEEGGIGTHKDENAMCDDESCANGEADWYHVVLASGSI